MAVCSRCIVVSARHQAAGILGCTAMQCVPASCFCASCSAHSLTDLPRTGAPQMSLQPPPADPNMLPTVDPRDFDPYLRTTAALYPLFRAGLRDPECDDQGKCSLTCRAFCLWL